MMKAQAEMAVVTNEEVEAQRDEVLLSMGHMLETRKRQAVAHKTMIEHRMQRDNDQYWGLTGDAATKEDIVAGNTNPSKGTPIDNKTRSMTRIASARIGDMLFPTNASNWEMRLSHDPEIDDELIMQEYQLQMQANPQQPGPDGQMPPPPEPNRDALAAKVGNRACRKMARKIKDCLTRCEYSKLGRQVIFDGCRVGTGILKAPYMKRTVRRKYMNEGGVAVLDAAVEVQPAVARVDPWMFFPQHARCIEESEYAFELHMYTATKIRQMVMTHGFYPKQVNDLLAQDPDRGSVDLTLRRRSSLFTESEIYEDSYAMWEYHGPLDKRDLELLGISIPDEDNLTAYMAEVWVSQGIVVRVSLSPLEADTSLPYLVFNYEEDEGSVFGYGIPFIMRDDQAVIDMSWEAMVHNMSVTAGPQLAIKKGLVTPADNSYIIAGPKLWYLNDEDMPIGEAIQSMVIPSTIQTNMPLYQQAKANADSNTNLPLMLGDSQAQSVQVGQGQQANLFNAQNIVQRQAAHNWDDHITRRLIGGFYDWHMQHDPDPSIRGDYEVEVRGASYLLIKDQQAQHAQLMVQMVGQDPEMAALVKKDELYRAYIGFMDIPSDQLLRTPEEVAAWQSQQGPDPLQQAEAAKAQAEADYAAARAELARAQAADLAPSIDPQTGQPMPEQGKPMDHVDMAKIQLGHATLMQKEADRDATIQIEMIRRDVAMMKLASISQVDYAKIQAQADESKTAREFTAYMKQADAARDDFFKAAELKLKSHELSLQRIDSQRGFDSGA